MKNLHTSNPLSNLNPCRLFRAAQSRRLAVRGFAAAGVALTLMLGGCGKGKPQSLAEMKNPSTLDSMMYYFGEMQANAYLMNAETDTALGTAQGEKAFLEGFRAGLNAETDDPCYNRGLQEGLRLAIRIREFNNAYNIDLPEEVLADALEYALRNKQSLDVAQAQKSYYRIRDRFDLEKVGREDEIAKTTLATVAGDMGLTMVSDTLYAKDVTPSKGGPKFKDGDKVALQLTASRLNGDQLGRQFPNRILIGEGRVPRVICLAIHTMTDGQTRTFISTPHAMFGNQAEKYKLSPDDPVVFTIKAERLPADASLDNTLLP